MRTALLILALLAAPAFAAQVVWKWVDNKGVTHYSDQPIPGAERMEISVGSRSDSSRATNADARSSSPSSAAAREETTTYRNFEIWKPGSQESVVNTGGVVEVAMRFEPALQPGHSLHLYFDGRLVEDFPANSLTHTLRDVPRGTHTLVARILDNRGNAIADSQLTQFSVRQQSAAQPPVGPNLRPPPKPRG